jgi:hypothetical protein
VKVQIEGGVYASPRGVADIGEVLDLPEAEARALIAARLAVPAGRDSREATPPGHALFLDDYVEAYRDDSWTSSDELLEAAMRASSRRKVAR